MTNNIIKFLTAGHVDDGKSTLIGKLLYETDSISDDQIESIKNLGNGKIDYSLFVEGLESERRQKITIDVAYRYFSYQNQKFIIADSPGHEQYTKNMAVAAANSDVAVILIDAIDGVQSQTIRHSYISYLFGIKNFIIAINKMDLVDYKQEVFEQIKTEFLDKISKLEIKNINFVPISALNSDNLIKLSSNTLWYQEKSLLDLLYQTKIVANKEIESRFLVQNVLKHQNKRFYQGKLLGKKLEINDKITIFPSEYQTIIKDIIFNSETNLSINLEDDFDIDRGVVFAKNQIKFSDNFVANLIWFSNKKLDLSSQNNCYIRINHNYFEAIINKINHSINIDNLSKQQNALIEQNQINNVEILLSQKVAFDPFIDNKFTGSFLLIDKNDNETLAVGLID